MFDFYLIFKLKKIEAINCVFLLFPFQCYQKCLQWSCFLYILANCVLTECLHWMFPLWSNIWHKNQVHCRCQVGKDSRQRDNNLFLLSGTDLIFVFLGGTFLLGLFCIWLQVKDFSKIRVLAPTGDNTFTILPIRKGVRLWGNQRLLRGNLLSVNPLIYGFRHLLGCLINSYMTRSVVIAYYYFLFTWQNLMNENEPLWVLY